MRTDQAKKLNLPEIMQRLGFVPLQVKHGGDQLWYASPFRQEKDASFQVSKGKIWPWVWNDHGDHASGTVLDFAMRYKDCSVSEALQFLDQLVGGTQDLFKPSDEPKNPSQKELFSSSLDAKEKLEERKASELTLLSVGKLGHPLIFSYLEKERGISRPLAEKYLKQVQYAHGPSGRTFFAMGIQNLASGHEIRIASDKHKFTKSCLGPKDIAVIPGSGGDKSHVNLVEGMLDALSLMQLYQADQLKYDTIILNTASFFDRTVEYIESQGYGMVNAFLDNDPAGKQFLEGLKDRLGEGRVIPQNHLYQGYKDVNAMLVANIPSLSQQRS